MHATRPPLHEPSIANYSRVTYFVHRRWWLAFVQSKVEFPKRVGAGHLTRPFSSALVQAVVACEWIAYPIWVLHPADEEVSEDAVEGASSDQQGSVETTAAKEEMRLPQIFRIFSEVRFFSAGR